MPPPESYLQWLHQTYESQWKGRLSVSTVPDGRSEGDKAMWAATIAAAGAVVTDASGQHVTLPPLSGSGSATSKKAAQQAAAQDLYEQLVAGGWHDPSKPAPPRKSGGVSRAGKFVADSTPANSNNPLAFLDISIDGAPVGRLVVELFRYKKGSSLEPHAPLAVDNFLALCRGVDIGGTRRSYAGVPFTRLMSRFVVQAGDVVARDGSSGAHIHASCGEHFPDEGLDDRNYRFARPFMLAAANLGLEDTNSSQFFITLAPAHQLDGHHTCFGKVAAGFGVVKQIEALARPGASPTDMAPPVPVLIEGAGELPPGWLAHNVVPPLSAGGYPLWPEDAGPPPAQTREAAHRLDVAADLRQQGNDAYKAGDAAAALSRYQQALRYLSWTSFKLRMPDGDADLDVDEQTALWDAEGVLYSNCMAALLRLGRFKDAAALIKELLRRQPRNPKALLRAAQTHIGLGPGEYGAAARLLGKALEHARQAAAPTRDIVAEMHRLRDLQRRQAARARTVFSTAFASGLLHHPADDEPALQGAAPLVAVPDLAAAAAGLRHVAAAPGRVPAGPVAPERVMERPGQAVVVDDAWGTHLLVADEDDDDEDEEEGEGSTGARGRGPNSYGAGLLRRLQGMGLAPKEDGDDNGSRSSGSSSSSSAWSDGEEVAAGGEHSAAPGEAAAVPAGATNGHAAGSGGWGTAEAVPAPAPAAAADDDVSDEHGVRPDDALAPQLTPNGGGSGRGCGNEGQRRQFGQGALNALHHKVDLL